MPAFPPHRLLHGGVAVRYFLTNKPRNSALVYVSFHLLLLLASTLDCVRHYAGCLLRRESLRPEDALAPLQLVLLVACQGWWGVALFVTMHCLSSWLLAALSFSVHRTEYAWTEGDAKPELDFGK